MAEKMCAMTSRRDGRGNNDAAYNDDEGAPSNEVRWEYSVKRHRRGGTSGGGGGPPRFRFADVNGVVIGVTIAINPINLNGIHEALERSGAAHRQRESFPLEPAPPMKRPLLLPKTTAMGGSGGETIKAASGVDPPWWIVIGGWGGNDDDHQQRCRRRQTSAVGRGRGDAVLLEAAARR